jgi:serine/threonine protein phosphatase PrpC
MAPFDIVKLTQAYRATCEDRVEVFHFDRRVVIVVADGAGGTGSGSQAAEMVVREVGTEAAGCCDAQAWEQVLTGIDHRIGSGESTAVVLDVTEERICGASVGDSRAWLIDNGAIVDLTASQNCKPLLGSGRAQPQSFEHKPWQGLLLAGSDGLFNYAKPEVVTRVVVQSDFYSLPRRLLESVQLPSGEYWDDVAIVVCRRQPVRRGRHMYEL